MLHCGLLAGTECTDVRLRVAGRTEITYITMVTLQVVGGGNIHFCRALAFFFLHLKQNVKLVFFPGVIIMFGDFLQY